MRLESQRRPAHTKARHLSEPVKRCKRQANNGNLSDRLCDPLGYVGGAMYNTAMGVRRRETYIIKADCFDRSLCFSCVSCVFYLSMPRFLDNLSLHEYETWQQIISLFCFPCRATVFLDPLDFIISRLEVTYVAGRLRVAQLEDRRC
jgi:hypothetical protein